MAWKRFARRLYATFAVGAVILGCFGGAERPASAAGPEYKRNEVVVKLNPASGATIGDINATYHTTTLKSLGSGSRVYLLRTPTDQNARQVADAMDTDLRLLFAEPNFFSRSPEASPSNIKAWAGEDAVPYGSQNAAQQLDLQRARNINQGTGSVVAVIDTGVQQNHPRLANRLTTARYDFVDNDTSPNDASNGKDDNANGLIDEGTGHGTHVAGIILLVAPKAKIMPLRALDTEGTGNEFSVAQAIYFAINHGAHVINTSLGTLAKSELFEDSARAATQRGVVVVAAGGNLNSRDEQYPGAANCSIGVTSVDSHDIKSSFANYGGWIDLAAPGESIYSSLPPNGYGWWSGTSMATPFVAGQAALLHSMRPALNPRSISAVIGVTARPLDNLNPNFDGEMGSGRIDVGASVARLAAGGAINNRDSLISGSCVEATGQ
jgi:subtilisin family serine protease